ncbi:MAG: hypothetical protein V1792_03415 [Pseudomonadota bacterium]
MSDIPNIGCSIALQNANDVHKVYKSSLKRTGVLIFSLFVILALVNDLPQAGAKDALDESEIESIFETERKPVTFCYSQGFSVERDVAQKTLGITEKRGIGIALRDLNDDGENEILVSLHQPDQCGARGCPLYILTRDSDNGWKQIVNILSVDQMQVLGTKKRSFRDLQLGPAYLAVQYNSRITGSSSRTEVPVTSIVWRFNGERYDALVKRLTCYGSKQPTITSTWIFDARAMKWRLVDLR